MKRAKAIIFDMDGTLYPFNTDGRPWTQTPLGVSVAANVLQFAKTQFGLDDAAAKLMLTDITLRFGDELSQAFEIEKQIPRRTFFDATWNLDATQIVPPQPELVKLMNDISTKKVLLSAAPRIWINNVLERLSLIDTFDAGIFDGEPDIRKPLPEAFGQIADALGLDPSTMVSIGDQEHTDIVPAKLLGMMTVLISPQMAASSADIVTPTLSEAITELRKKNVI